MAIALDELLERLEKTEENVIFLGDGVPVFETCIRERLGNRASFAPAHLLRQRAGAVAVRAMEYYRQGRYVTAAEHKPEYLRLSQAERERLEKECTHG